MNIIIEMNKKHLILGIATVAVLMAVITVSVICLYSDRPSGKKAGNVKAAAEYKLLPAVPADAAMVFCMKDLKGAVSLFTDSSTVFSAFVAENGKKGFQNFIYALKAAGNKIGSLKSSDVIVSVHNSGNLVPMMIMSAGNSPADTTSQIAAVMAIADSSGLSCRLVDCSLIPGAAATIRKSVLLEVSSSETLLTASVRHIENGTSILDKDSFPQAAASMNGEDAVFISHGYAGKLIGAYLRKPYSATSGFFGKVADWTALAVKERGAGGLTLSGTSTCSGGPSYYRNMLAATEPGEPVVAEILPASTLFAITIPTEGISGYIDLYSKYLDSTGNLDKRRRGAVVLKDSVGISPEHWAKRIDVREACKAVIMSGGEPQSMIFIRPGKKDEDILLRGTGLSSMKEYKGGVCTYAFGGFAGAVFGKVMDIPEEDCFIFRNGWIISGSRKAVSSFADGSFGKETLKDLLSSAGLASRVPGKNVSALAYYSVSEDVASLGSVFRPVMADAFKSTLSGLSYEPVIMSVSGEEITVTAHRVDISMRGSVPAAVKDTSVMVPTGPFRVKNSGTGRTNLFGQSSNMTLTLKEEDGKGIWGVPFGSPICGAAENIDYYANGKLQILFAAGSKLYLIDRLGRFVSQFPVDLGKEILLGPGVYDFTGAKGYTAVVLHKDNTIGMYDLHGRKASWWNGIKSDDTIKGLPELIEVKGKKYWVVRTSVQSLIYGYNGGEPVVKASGDKMIRPDSAIEVQNGRVKVTCYDGKVRNINVAK